MIERRRAYRFHINWPVAVRHNGDRSPDFEAPGNLVDLSSRGAYLSVRKKLRLGSKLDLWIRVPHEVERWMVYTAEIVRVEESSLGPRVAVRFTTVRAKFVNEKPDTNLLSEVSPSGAVSLHASHRQSKSRGN